TPASTPPVVVTPDVAGGGHPGKEGKAKGHIHKKIHQPKPKGHGNHWGVQGAATTVDSPRRHHRTCRRLRRIRRSR
ncbi:MAG: hypothetical protein ABI553_02900, partial [Chloroflexota bacterium]